ncbi:aspartyl protease family protein [Pseudochryseolinea flava]|uniref:Peptidase A2 domain-containing protein n=1 Tax=Pseudochryseolinea flava TaxID=2059302 RepID=A0A364YAP1_9BACT|nr:aspartyl protease family protein [Pseudochryseolinea flava]RAW03202.1 hypothetical protein DQQ10_03700 [Pseudochryseolinea flava]
MIRKIGVLFFLFLSLQSRAQNLGFTLPPGQHKVAIPIEINNNLVVVPVVLNEALPLKFIIDTGVRTAILTQKTFADILNLPYTRKYTIAGPGATKSIEAFITTNVTLRLPGVLGRGHALLVLAEDYLELRNYLGTDVHGVLGYELFSRFIVDIDYERKLMTLRTPEKFKKRSKFHTLPMTVEDTKPYIKTSVVMKDGKKISVKLLVDSGASHSLLLDPNSSDEIQVPENTVSSTIGRGLGGEITGKVGRISSLNIGTYSVDKPLANFPDPNSYVDTLKMSSVYRNGSLGGEMLSRFHVIFNFPKEELYVKKNSYFRKKFHYNLSGVIVKAKGSRLDVFEVQEIREKSPSDVCGLLPGDIILKLNGLETKQLTLNLINGLLNSKPGKKIRLEIERNGQRVKKEFLLADQI